MGFTTSRLMTIWTVLGSLLAVLCTALPAQAVLKTTAVSGDWNTGTNWSLPGVPVPGTDWVDVNLNMSVSTNTSFGDSSGANVSTMSGGNPIFTMNGASILQHVAGSTLQITSSQPFVSGTGTFQNSGTIENYSNRFLYLGGSTTVDNLGSFQFRGSASTLDFYDLGTPKFINNGNVTINMTAASNIARIYAEQVPISGGQFIQNGSPIQWVQGVLAFAPPSIGGTGIGSSITDANFPLLFNTASLNAGSAQLRLGGGVNITLDSTVTNLSNVYIGEASAPLYGTPGGTTVNVTGAGIRTSSSVGGQFDTKAIGNSIINQGTIVVANNGGQFWVDGNGSFNNTGTLNLQNNRFLIGVNGDPTINNSGIIRFTENNARIDMWTGASIINSMPGGQLIIDLPNATDVARIGSESQLASSGWLGQYRQMGGNPTQFIQGTFIFAPTGGINAPLTDSLFASMFGPINANSTLILSGGVSNISLSSTDVSRVRLGSAVQTYDVTAGNSVLNVTAAGGLRTANGAPTANIAAGRTLTNNGTLVMSSAQEFWLNGDGTLINNGTLTVENNRFLLGVSGNPTVNNSGTINFTENNSRIDLYGSSPTFNNQVGGVVKVDLNLGTSSSDIGRESGTGGTFTNLGTIEVLKGELVIESGITTTTAVTGGGTTLATGDWRVLANGARSRLNLQVGGTGIGGAAAFDGTITSIAAAAGLVLSNQASGTVEFPQLGALQSVAGELYVHGMNLPVDAALNVTGTLGGDGIITSPGTITLSGGELDPSSLTGGPGTLTLNGNLLLGNTTQLSFSLDNAGIVGGGVNDLVVVNGNLTLDGVLDVTSLPNFGAGTYRLFNYTGTLFDNGVTLALPNYVVDVSTIGQVNLIVLPVPEPSTGLLMLAGLVGLRRRKRS